MPRQNKKKIDEYKKLINSLHSAWEQLRKHAHKETAGSDNETILTYSSDYSSKISSLGKKLADNSFKFKPLRRATVEKGREILIQTVEERIVSKAILDILAPTLEKTNSNQDFSRPVKYVFNGVEPDINGIPLAVKVIQRSLEEGLIWVFEADIKGFFDHVPKKNILEILRKKIKNQKILELVKQVLYFTPEVSPNENAKLYTDIEGIAQGSPLSPIFASIYLYTFDMFIVEEFPDAKLVRYVDDFIILCNSEKRAKEIYEASTKKIKEMGLSMYALNEKKAGTDIEKTKITCAKGGSFDFLGLSFNYIDVDISNKKKIEIDLNIKEIIHSGNTNFLVKTRQIESRLRAYIDHYKKAHYKRTVASLNKITKFAENELRSYYITTYKNITHKDPFAGLSDSTTENLFKFMGIDFKHITDKINKTNTPRPKHIRQKTSSV